MLFFDTSFIIGLFNENDDNHHKVKELLEIEPNISKQKKAINNIDTVDYSDRDELLKMLSVDVQGRKLFDELKSII